MKRSAYNWKHALVPAGLLLAAGLLLVPGACTVLVPSEPEDPVFENPQDPDGSNYVAPETNITGGPSEGSTVTTLPVQFTWSGNNTAMVFRVRLNGGSWSQWVRLTSWSLVFLDETDYTFEVQGAYDPGQGNTPTLIDETPASRSFTVDAVQGPSLRFSPPLSEASANQNFTLNLIAEEVSNVMLVSTVIRFNPDHLMVTGDPTDGAFLTSTGGSIARYYTYDNAAGRLEINMATATGSPPGVSGTGILATIPFRAKIDDASNITFTEALSVMRDPDNNPISINSLVGARVRQPQ